MSRPPESNHPLVPWAILVLVSAVAFLLGMAVVTVILVVVTAGVGWPYGRFISWRSPERIDALVASPLFGTVILAAGIAAAIWAAMVVWRTLRERKERPEGSTPSGRRMDS